MSDDSKGSLDLCDSEKRVRGHLRIAALPRRDGSSLKTIWKVLHELSGEPSGGIQLLEGTEYRYEWDVPEETGPLISDPEELFQADTASGRSGRLRPGLSTGSVRVLLRAGDRVVGTLEFEVRSRKLNYESEYRWMLRDVAEQMTELLMERFASSEMNFSQNQCRDAVTLYQRFAFLKALFESETFQLALAEILRRPHTQWQVQREAVHAGAAMPADSHTLRQIVKAGPRVTWVNGSVPTMPARVERRRTHASHDTTPNRFVKFALERWRQVINEIDAVLASSPTTSSSSRGRREIASVLAQLELVLNNDLFRELGILKRFPADDQTLQRRDGYRDLFKAYVEFELAAQLSWRDTEDDYDTGQRDVATLYEYWAFIQLAGVLAQVVGQSFDMTGLIETRGDGLNVVLRSGVETVLAGTVERLGRTLFVELCFNRTYSSGQYGSWTRAMRPDYSLVIRDRLSEFDPVVIHFDAKYRVEFIADLFGAQDIPENALSLGEKRGGVLRDDLLKMHAYRDAIRRTAGAYVIYPGGDEEIGRNPFTEYHELLPGLGAFVLRPTKGGNASGQLALRKFIDDVLDHVATRLTQHERGRFWLKEVFDSSPPKSGNSHDRPPPPDTPVLLGFVKGVEHWEWIVRQKLYNVRTESRSGGVHGDSTLWQSQLIVLYCPSIQTFSIARIVSEPLRLPKVAMQAMQYPNPSSDYWCVQLSQLKQPYWFGGLSASSISLYVQKTGLMIGEPTMVKWSQLIGVGKMD